MFRWPQSQYLLGICDGLLCLFLLGDIGGMKRKEKLAGIRRAITVSPQPQQALTGSYPARAVKSLHSLRHNVLISGVAENAHNQPVPSG